jgi:hypothetical protein
MGVKITSIGTRAPWNTRVLPPVTRGLVGWFELDTEARRGAFNRAIGSSAGQVIGNPIETPTHLGSMSYGTGFVQTDITETVEFTAFCLFRVRVPSTIIAGTFVGPANTELGPHVPNQSQGTSFYVNGGGGVQASASRIDANGNATPVGLYIINNIAGDSGWCLAANRVTVSKQTVWNKTNNLRNNIDNQLARVPSASPWRIGSYTNITPPAWPGTADVSQLIIYNLALTDGEVEQIFTVMRKRATRLGINA